MPKYLIILLFTLGMLTPGPASANVRVFACEPEWGALAMEIGGDKANVIVATSAKQDPHFISARPSLIAQVRRADLVFCNGADLEIGWLPLLLRQAGNAGVQPGTPGYLEAASFVKKLEVPTSLDRSLGDIHPQGNPHIATNPHNIFSVAQILAERLSAIAPGDRAYFVDRLASFNHRWTEAMTRWERQAEGLRGVPVVVQHSTWVYLVQWLGLNVVVTLEPKPGIPPSTSHLETVLETLRSSPAKMIINAAYENDKPSRWLAERSGLPEVSLPFTVGGSKEADDLFRLFDVTVGLLVENGE